MAINPESEFVGKIAAATTEYPYGSARDITVPGDGTGTPWKAVLVNDVFGFQQSLLSEAAVVPSGSPDEVGASQYLQAVKNISGSRVADFTAMRALDSSLIADGQIITVTNDGIGGTFKVKTGTVTDNNGTLVVFTDDAARYVERVFVKETCVTWFGTVGDGVADDTTAIQAALDSLISGGKLYFPPGTYNFTALTITYKKSVIYGAGFLTILSHTGTGDAITCLNETWSGLVLRDFKLTGTGSSGHGLYMDDGVATGNMGNARLANLYINGFSASGKAGFYGKQLYNFTFDQVQVHDCYDGIYFGEESINNRLFQCWIRGMTRYGFAIVGVSGNECFNNNFLGGVIDEDDGSNAGIGIYSHRNHTSTFSDIHFEDLDKGILIDNGIQHRIVNNQFAVNITTAAWETGALSSNTYVEGNRYLSDIIIDNGIRTLLLNDNPYSDVGDGGGSDSRVSVGVSDAQVGYFTQDAGKGFHLQGRELAGYSKIIPNKIFGLGIITGADDTSVNAAFLTDTTASWTIDEHVGKTISNTTDGSSGTITANTATTVTATLSGGTEDDWDSGDAYSIGASANGAPHITESDIVKVATTAAVNLDGFSSLSSIAGRKVTLYFADGNTTLRHGISGTTDYYFRLDGGVSFNPAVNDSITLLCLGDRTWLELSRMIIA